MIQYVYFHVYHRVSTDKLKISTQTVPPPEPLLASMPQGREMHFIKQFELPSLDEDVLARMRAPAEGKEYVAEEDSGSDDDMPASDPVGAFPGTRADYTGESAYY